MKTYGVYLDETMDKRQCEFKEPEFLVEGKTALEAYQKALAGLGYDLLEMNDK